MLPAARPAAAVLGLFTFMQAWKDFFWPLVMLRTIRRLTLTLTGTLLATLPILVVFMVLGRQIVAGVMQGAVKG